MADGFDIHLDAERAAQLKAAADLLGLTPEAYAVALIDAGLGDRSARTIDPDPEIDEAIADAIERGEEPTVSLDVFSQQLRRFGARRD